MRNSFPGTDEIEPTTGEVLLVVHHRTESLRLKDEGPGGLRPWKAKLPVTV